MSRLILRSAAILLATVSLSAGQQSATQTPLVSSTQSTLRASTATRVVGSTPTPATTMIQGNALDSENGRMAYAVVRLRDARFGRIVDTELTDASGLFEFRAVDPGSYIVEVMGKDSSVLAASQILNVNAGEVASAIVKLPFKASSLAGILGANGLQTAALVMTQAAASGVFAVIPTDPVSPLE